ncbi:MAG TPA: PAS domain-containing protein, partial [Gemmataceae bacterium]|nr:PAS domain-containing protein [Gemmataceae bacterium]
MADSDPSQRNANQAGEELRPTGEQARTILDTIPIQIWTGPADGTLEYCNHQWRAYAGLSLEELRGHGWQRILHPDDKDGVLKAWQEAVANGAPYEREERHRGADGVYRWFLCRRLPLRDAEGRVERWYGANTDIEDGKRAEGRLRESERRLNQAQRIAHVGHWEHDLEAGRVTASDEAYRIFGSPPQESLQTWAAWQEPLDPKDLGIRSAAVERLVREGPRYEAEYRVVRPDGEARVVHSRGEIERDAAGRPRRLFGIVQDVTERRRADEEFRRTAALLQAVIDGTSDAVFVKDRQGKYLLFNAAASRSTGKPAAEVIGRDDTAVFDPASARAVMEHDRRVMESGTASTEEQDLLVAGVRSTYLTTKVPYRDEHGRVIGIIGVSHDITERKRAEGELRRSEEMLRRAEAMAHFASWTLTAADGVVLASEEAQRLFGWRPGPHRLADLMALVHPDDRPGVEAAMRAALAGTPFEAEHRIVVGGEVKWVRRRVEPESDTAGRVVRLVGVSQNVTERRKLEEQFRQAQKMEAVGTLAGGVAHDFNNLLTVINGCSDLLLSSLKRDDPMRDLLVEISKAGERAGALTRQLLMFSRRQVIEPKVLDLNAVVADTEKMLRRLIGEDVVLTAALDPSL